MQRGIARYTSSTSCAEKINLKARQISWKELTNRRGFDRISTIDRSTNRYRDQVRCPSYFLCSQTSLVCICTCDTVCSSMRTYIYIYIFAATRYKKRRFVLLSNENALKDAVATFFSLYTHFLSWHYIFLSPSLSLSLSISRSLTLSLSFFHSTFSSFFFCKNFYSSFFFVYFCLHLLFSLFTLYVAHHYVCFFVSSFIAYIAFCSFFFSFFTFSSFFFFFFFLISFLVSLTAI